MKSSHHIGTLIIRLSIGILMLLHGIGKLIHGIGPIENALTARGLPAFLAFAVFFGEILAPIGIIFGYRTRLSAIILTINCIVAIYLMHAGQIFSLNSHGAWSIELIGLYLFGAIALIFTGGGKLSLSRRSIWD